ncbi:protein BIG GRAIN 1-like E [Amaranthus tricolor]|uniref:protein BIG GRAIN 1-like E n=1 Tax=Amaranthus tricolor TaxID=29722 RepID=UPI0025904B5E|nr:protein BIG GRAIN 1-like E [Amaranthus tricolor]
MTVTAAAASATDFKSFSDYKDVLATLSKYNIQENGNGNVRKDEKIKGSFNLDWFDEKIRLKNGLVEKSKNFYHGYKEKTEHKKFNHDDDDHDGAESDSSSDLFELQIDYVYGCCSSGLPVYKTTHMDSIKRSSATAITNGPIKA